MSWEEIGATLDGKPYLLDPDQVRAVLDEHKNTLVTARAGSGKTRVIVAKIAYQVAAKGTRLDEIKAFMFNRAAAAEVNERLMNVRVGGKSLVELSGAHGKRIAVASTFHKFALDTLKLAEEEVDIISEDEQKKVIADSLREASEDLGINISQHEYLETLQIISNFITRAGQKFPGEGGLEELGEAMRRILESTEDTGRIKMYRLALGTYERYLSALRPPKIDFNILMARATEILLGNYCEAIYPRHDISLLRKIEPLKYILVDEYQDFSDLFYNILDATRTLAPEAKLFAVGDDWQAINRFAGSDVDYFINFSDYFSDDVTRIDLKTNYRSCRRIVENANKYMLANYDPDAVRAVAFNPARGKVCRADPLKVKFDATDIDGDGFNDGMYQKVLIKYTGLKAKKILAAAKLLKKVVAIIRRNRRKSILLLHRHNYLSTNGVALEIFYQAVRDVVAAEGIMSEKDFETRVRCMTMHKSKGLEADVVILLEMNREQVLGEHPHATLFPMFGDSREAEKADQHRLIYVALTRAREKLYILTSDKKIWYT